MPQFSAIGLTPPAKRFSPIRGCHESHQRCYSLFLERLFEFFLAVLGAWASGPAVPLPGRRPGGELGGGNRPGEYAMVG